MAKISDLVVEAEGVGLAEVEEQRMLPRLVGIVDRLPVGQREHEAAADEQHRQRGDEAGNLQDGDEHAVQQADPRAQQQAEQDRGHDAEVEEARGEQPGEDHRHQAVGGADREVEVLVDDDEGHADGDDADAGRVAQQRVQRLGRAEEAGIDDSPADVEQRDQGEEPAPPSRRPAGTAHGRAMGRGTRHGLSWPVTALREGVAPSRSGPGLSGQVSSRSACRRCRRCPWSRAGPACRGWRPRCRGRSAARAASPARSPAGRAAARASRSGRRP